MGAEKAGNSSTIIEARIVTIILTSKNFSHPTWKKDLQNARVIDPIFKLPDCFCAKYKLYVIIGL
jgi:hypothetical protein